MILPLLALLIPLWRLYPAVNAFRVDRILRRKYAALRDAEQAINATGDPASLRAALDRLDVLRSDLETLSRRLPANCSATSTIGACTSRWSERKEKTDFVA